MDSRARADQMTQLNTYSRKKGFKTLSRALFLNITEVPKKHSPTIEPDIELDDDYSSGLCDKNQQFENQTLKNKDKESSISPTKRAFDGNEDCKEWYHTITSEHCAPDTRKEEEIKESPPKKKNTGKRVLKMKSNSISRDGISDEMHKVSLKDDERREIKAPISAHAPARNPVNHTVSKFSNTYASIARSYVEANESYSLSEAQRAKEEGLESSDDEVSLFICKLQDSQQLKIHELKEAGAMRRFQDQMVYIFDGFMSQMISLQKASLAELISNMESEGFLIKLRSSDWVTKIFKTLILVPDECVKNLVVVWLEIIARDSRSVRTLDISQVESLILERWINETKTPDSRLLMLTYWVLRAQDSTNQKLSTSMVQSLRMVCDPINRWIDSSHQKTTVECIEIWIRSSNNASAIITADILEYILELVSKDVEPKICMNILLAYVWTCDSLDRPKRLQRMDFIQQLVKYAVLAIETDQDPLELSLCSVEILACLIDCESMEFIKILDTIDARNITKTNYDQEYKLYQFLLDIFKSQEQASLYAANIMFFISIYAYRCPQVRSELYRLDVDLCTSLLEEFMEFKTHTLAGSKVLAAVKNAIQLLTHV